MPPVNASGLTPALARRIRLVGLDVDGVLTDGGIYLGDVAGAPHEFKRYDIQDGLGVFFMREAGSSRRHRHWPRIRERASPGA